MTDPLVTPLVELLLACLCETAVLADNPPQNCCLRLAGEVPQDADMVHDMCCEGLAYVSVGDMWVSVESFPAEDIIRQSNTQCPPAAWGVELKMGLIRCAPVAGETDLDMPTCDDWTAAAHQAITDGQTLRKAACCFWPRAKQLDQMAGMSVIIGRQSANTPQGGCVERSTMIQVQFPANCDGC